MSVAAATFNTKEVCFKKDKVSYRQTHLIDSVFYGQEQTKTV